MVPYKAISRFAASIAIPSLSAKAAAPPSDFEPLSFAWKFAVEAAPGRAALFCLGLSIAHPAIAGSIPIPGRLAHRQVPCDLRE